MQNSKIGILSGYLMCLIALVSVRLFSKIPLGIGPVHYVAGFSLIVLSFYVFFSNRRLHSPIYFLPFLYIIWVFFSIYRGFFYISSGFIFNQFLHGILNVSSPFVVLLFSSPIISLYTLRCLNKFLVLYGFLSFKWNIDEGSYSFFFTPFIYLYLCFLNKIPLRWRIVTITSAIMVLLSIETTSGIIKCVVSIGTLLLFLLPRKLRTIGVHIGHWLFYIGAIVLLFLGITGQYNVFNGKSANRERSSIIFGKEKQIEGPIGGHVDTRTFIYEEMIASSFLYDHFWIGRTPARGYYSPSFAKDADKSIEGIDASERFCSEVANLNTFSWLGMIGLILLTAVYLQGTCLALYCSNNIFVKCIAMTVAFQWAYGWVENMNQFMLIDLMIYFNLSLCYSPFFRKMSNLEFECWFKSLFEKSGEISVYTKYHTLKYLLVKKLVGKYKKEA